MLELIEMQESHGFADSARECEYSASVAAYSHTYSVALLLAADEAIRCGDLLRKEARSFPHRALWLDSETQHNSCR